MRYEARITGCVVRSQHRRSGCQDGNPWLPMFRHLGEKTQPLLAIALSASVLVGITGCGPAGPSVEPVSGTVLLDGAAVPGATVVLTPTGGGLAATGMTGADGRFTVATVMSGKSWPGAAQGTYSVTATKIEAAAGAVIDPNDPKYDPLASVNPGSGPKYVIPKDYGEQATSGLTATITKGKNDLKFELDSKFKAKK